MMAFGRKKAATPPAGDGGEDHRRAALDRLEQLAAQDTEREARRRTPSGAPFVPLAQRLADSAADADPRRAS